MEFEFAFVKAGGLLLSGADPTGNGGALAGFADQRNIELLVEAGFTFPEAIGARLPSIASNTASVEVMATLCCTKSAIMSRTGALSRSRWAISAMTLGGQTSGSLPG